MKWQKPDATPPGSTLVPVVWYETISQWRAAHGNPPSSLFFNKIATLTRLRLEGEGVSVPLPYCWYLFGPTVADTPYNVRFQSEIESERTSVDWSGRPPELFHGDHSADAIRETVARLISSYPPGLPERIVNEAYRYAPFEFQRKFRRIRIAAGVTGQSSSERPAETIGGFLGMVSDAFDDFPYDRFSDLAPLVGPVREATAVAWADGEDPNRSVITEMLEGFWNAYSSYLRVVAEGHKNVTSRHVQAWRSIAEARKRIFVRNFGDVVVELSKVTTRLEDDPTLGPLIERRLAEQNEEGRMIRSGLEIMSSMN